MGADITVIRRDGTAFPLASRGGGVSIVSATLRTALLSEDTLSVTVSSPAPLPLDAGDRAFIGGRPYTLNKPPQVTKEGERRYTTELTMEGPQYDLLRVRHLLPSNAYGDTYYATLPEHLRVLSQNVERVFPGQWDITTDIADGEYRNLTTADKNCLEALQELCEAFGAEFVTGRSGGMNTLRVTKDTGIHYLPAFRYGKGRGLYSLQRANAGDTDITNRLYAYGGAENLPSYYGAAAVMAQVILPDGTTGQRLLYGRDCGRLCLPGKTRLTSYVEDAESIARYGLREGARVYDITPRRVGTVSAVEDDGVTFSDGAMFDLNEKKSDGVTTKYLIPGTAAKVKFQTGQLAGYEFEVAGYNHAGRKFTINKFRDENGLEFPGGAASAFRIAAGDEYILTDILLPDSYVADAERKLLESAEADLPAMAAPRVSYRLTLDAAFLARRATQHTDDLDLYKTSFGPLEAGGYIHVTDRELGVDREVRITRVERDLTRRNAYELTLSDEAVRPASARLIAGITRSSLQWGAVNGKPQKRPAVT